jgi:TolB-like protein/DNA-binding winged helix-turn-helix (wHTH) protein
MAKPSTIRFDDWTLHRESGELERHGVRVRLQDLPFQILDELLMRPGEVVTREQLIGRLWPKTVVDFDANLNSGVRRLRAALNEDANSPRYIETLPRRGYRYIGSAPGADLSTPTFSTPASDSSQVATPVGNSGNANRSWIARAAALVAAAAAIAGAVFLTADANRRIAADPSIVPAGAMRLRLAVLPFKNLSPDPDNAFFTDGMHEEILSTLASRASSLEVVSRTTMMSYRETLKPVQVVAKELGVTHVLEGSVRRDGANVRLTLQLIDARNDVRLWSKNFDRQLSDTLALQSEVAEEVGAQLAVTLSGSIGDLPRSRNPEAYDLYLKSRLSMSTIHAARSPRVQLQAQELLDRAIGLDPTFAAAFLARARLRLARFINSQDVSEANLAALRSDLGTARGMTGDTAPLLVTEAAYAHLVDFDSAKALRLLETASAMNPNGAEVCLHLGRILGFTGRRDEALNWYRRAVALDPANPLVTSDWATLLKLLGRAEEALDISRDFDARYPGLITYGWRLFAFTGQVDRFEREIARPDATTNPEAQLAAQFNVQLFARRYAALARLTEATEMRTIAQSVSGMLTIPSVGRKPVAELHGWAMLLGNDVTAARDDGRALQDFVARQPLTRWNAWYLKLLAAEAALFTGDRAGAIRETRAALSMAPRDIHPGIQLHSRSLAARIFAWAEADDEALTLLEQLSTEYPMSGPAEIARDPLYAVPLATNPRYQQLERKLEARIAANQPLRDAD